MTLAERLYPEAEYQLEATRRVLANVPDGPQRLRRPSPLQASHPPGRDTPQSSPASSAMWTPVALNK